MKKKHLFLGGAIITLALVSGIALNKTFAVGPGDGNGGDNYYSMGMMGRMMNWSDGDYQKMNDAHRLMREGKYDEARSIMKNLGMGGCPMWDNDTWQGGSNNYGDYGGMMGGGYGSGMMGR